MKDSRELIIRLSKEATEAVMKPKEKKKEDMKRTHSSKSQQEDL